MRDPITSRSISEGTSRGLKRWWRERKQKMLDKGIMKRCPKCKKKDGSAKVHYSDHPHVAEENNERSV